MARDGLAKATSGAETALTTDWRALLDLMGDGVLVLDLDSGAILDANRTAEVLWGLTADELRGRSMGSLSEGHAPYTEREVLDRLRRAAAGEPQAFEWRARGRSGEPFWIEVRIARARCSGQDRLLASVRDVTSRKRVEDALRESESRARRRAEALAAALQDVRRLDAERSLAVDVLERGDAVLVLDAEMRIVLVNARQEQLSRRPREESVGRHVWDVFPEGASPGARFRGAFEKVMHERVPERLEEYYAPLDLWTSVSVYPTHQGGIAVFVRDVSERRRAELAVRERETFDSRVLASSLNGIYVIDLDAHEPTYVNARYTQLTGYTLDDLRAQGGNLIDRLFHPDDRARMRAHLAALLRAPDGAVLDVEYRFRARDGRWMSCFSRETPFARAADGRVRQLIGTFVDVTELRRAEQAARESEARYRMLFETMTEAFAVLEAVCDPEGRPVDCRLIEVNPAFERLTGVAGARVVGRLLGEVAPDEVGHWVRTYAEVALTGRPAHFEHRSTVPPRDYEVYAFSPRPPEFALLFVDITDRKRVEAELRDADRRKNEFLGVLSHELRNPLAPIRNSLYLLQHAPPDGAEAARARRVLLRQTEHLTRLVDDLLDVTRISRGKVLLQPARIEAREAILRSCDDHRSLFDEARVELRTEVAPAPVWVNADPTRLSQIVGNLLQNAVKFTPEGGTVVVEATAVAGALEIRVRDTGLGLTPDELGRMFEPFAQAHRSLARTRGGLGLGLALVKGLVELHGGTISATSDGSDRGATFTVRLPLAAPPGREARGRGDVARARRGARTGFRRRRVLVVDDDRDAAESLADLLRAKGHEVEVALDGSASIERVRRTAPDVVLCDLGLPGMSGFDVARVLRAEAGSSIRLIAVSGYARPEDVRKAVEAGFEAHVAKPPDPAVLERLLA